MSHKESRAALLVKLARNENSQNAHLKNKYRDSKKKDTNLRETCENLPPELLRVKRKLSFDIVEGKEDIKIPKKKVLNQRNNIPSISISHIIQEDPFETEQLFPQSPAVAVRVEPATPINLSPHKLTTLEPIEPTSFTSKNADTQELSTAKDFILAGADGIVTSKNSKGKLNITKSEKVKIISNDIVNTNADAVLNKKSSTSLNKTLQNDTQKVRIISDEIIVHANAEGLSNQNQIIAVQDISINDTDSNLSDSILVNLSDAEVISGDIAQESLNISTSNTQEAKGRPKKGRKLKHPPQDRAMRKKYVIQNKGYYSQKGTFKTPKEFNTYVCRCDCLNVVGRERVKKEFDKFYSVDSHSAQIALICAMVKEMEVKRKRNKKSNKKKFTRLYTINNTKVCKNFFVHSFKLSSEKITSALKSFKRPEGVKDLRGIRGGSNKITDEKLNAVIAHINKFPRYKSHYRSNETNTEYLTPETTLKRMYQLYTDENSNNPVSIATYKRIFYTHFNLKRKPLKEDICNTCDKLQILIQNETGQTLQDLIEQKDLHCNNAETARRFMKIDIENSKSNDELEVLTYDLQRTLPLPRIPTNLIFYLRQLWLYNSGVYSGKFNKSFCYLWIEGLAGRGAQEVASCLRYHILNKDEIPNVKTLVLWSDSCGGQNRNIKIVLIMKSVLEAHPTLKTITFKYLIPGHSFLPNDNDFGDIEKGLKLQQRLYTPKDYINIILSCRKKNPIVATEMQSSNFISSAKMEKSIVNRKKDTSGSKINWLQFRVIEIRKDKPSSIFVKSDFESSFAEIDLQKKGRRGCVDELNNMIIPLWPNGKSISEKKLKDIKSIISLIPKDALQFYKNLVSDPNITDDIDGFNAELDFEFENEADE